MFMKLYKWCSYLQHKKQCLVIYLQPRNPNIGFTSDNFSTRASTSSSLTPVSLASSVTISSISPSGKNSWRGGSNRRIVTGRPEVKCVIKRSFQHFRLVLSAEINIKRQWLPFIARKMPSKSDRWYGNNFASCTFRSVVSDAMIICLTAFIRSSDAKNWWTRKYEVKTTKKIDIQKIWLGNGNSSVNTWWKIA